MGFLRCIYLVCLVVAPRLAVANTPLSDAFVLNDIATNEGKEIAYASRPLWHFGQSQSRAPCYPTWALTPDGKQAGVNPGPWSDASSGCPHPGPYGLSNPFPTYYTVSYCGDDELRVVYNLYFQKDGWSNTLISLGHMHDWERIIVIWRRTGGQWTRRELLKSFHSGYMHDNWKDVQNTFNDDNWNEQDGKDKDHAKIYVGWGKHAMFSTRNTGWNDAVSQGCGREFRSRDWWYSPTRDYLIPSGADSDMGQELSNFNWGSADSIPFIVEERVCKERVGGFTAC